MTSKLGGGHRRKLQVPKVPDGLGTEHRNFLQALKNQIDALQGLNTPREQRPTLEEFEGIDLKTKSIRSEDAWVWDELDAGPGMLYAEGATTWGTGFDAWIFGPTGTSNLHYCRKLPNYYVEGSDINIHFHWSNNTTNTGNARMNARYRWFNVLDVIPAWSSTLTWDMAATGVANEMSVANLFDVGGQGMRRNSFVQVELWRDGDHANDTYANNIGVFSIDVMYKRRAELPRGLGVRSIYYQ